jgi:hypothetical protein
VERTERIEYVVAVNRHRDGERTLVVPTGASARVLLSGACISWVDYAKADESTMAADATGGLRVTVPALGAVVWRAEQPAGSTRRQPPTVRLVRAARGGGTFLWGPRD